VNTLIVFPGHSFQCGHLCFTDVGHMSTLLCPCEGRNHRCGCDFLAFFERFFARLSTLETCAHAISREGPVEVLALLQLNKHLLRYINRYIRYIDQLEGGHFQDVDTRVYHFGGHPPHPLFASGQDKNY